MSDDELERITERIKQIEKLTEKKTTKSKKKSESGKKYGSYQHFQSECMKKVDKDNPNSPSRIEIITGNKGAHSTERMAQCSRLWKKYRGEKKPVEEGLMKELEFAQKVEKGEVEKPSE